MRACSFLDRRVTTQLAIVAVVGLLVPVAVAVVPAIAQEDPAQSSPEVIPLDELPTFAASELPASTLPALFAFFAAGDGTAVVSETSDGDSGGVETDQVLDDVDSGDSAAAGPPPIFPPIGLLPADLLAVAARDADEQAMVWLLAADENSQLADWAGSGTRLAAFERAQANYQRALENYRAAKERAKRQRDDALQRRDERLEEAMAKRERALERRSVRLAELQQRLGREVGPPEGAGPSIAEPQGRPDGDGGAVGRAGGLPGLASGGVSGRSPETGPPSDFPGGTGAGRGQ